MPDWGLEIEGAVASIWFDCEGAKVNTLNGENMTLFKQLVLEAEAHSTVETLIIRSRKPAMFIAGADISLIQQMNSESEALLIVQEGQSVLNTLEDSRLKTIALINGPCLGGGLELALACDFRLATNDSKVLIGLPEVKLGVLPGFGGTQRLPRLIGLRNSLDLILTGKMIKSDKALRLGVVDGLVETAFIESQLSQFIGSLKSKAVCSKLIKNRGFRGILETTMMGRYMVFKTAKKTVLKQTKGHYPAPLEILNVMKRTVKGSLSKRLEIEAKGFAKLAPTSESKSLIKLFFMTESFKKYTGILGDQSPKFIESASVLGAGLMGGGISWLFLNKDIPVRLKDLKWPFISKAYATANQLFQSRVKRRRLSKGDKAVKMNRLTGTLSYSGVDNSDIIVEAIPENMDLKKQTFKQLEQRVSKDTILASNTSALSITEMADGLEFPDRFVGMHFFSPVHKMPLVEVIRGDQTSDQTVCSVVALAKRCGKTPVVVKNCPGFLVNRILIPYVNEAIRLASEGVAISRIDQLARDFGMPVGPLELADEVGLDVGYKVSKILHEGYGDRMALPEVFELISENGMPLKGKKSGEGFYKYSHKDKVESSQMKQWLSSGSTQSSLSDTECLDRLILIMVNEAARCLEESVVESPDHLDMAMIMGCGFPPFRGGLWSYAESQSIDKCVKRLSEFNQVYGLRFKVSDYFSSL